MSAQDRPPHGPCAPDVACGCTACVAQAERGDAANQLRNLRLFIQQMGAETDREEEEAGATGGAPAGRAQADRTPTWSDPAGRAAQVGGASAGNAAQVGAAWAGNAGVFPGHQWRAQGAAPTARIYQGASGPERLAPAERRPTWRDAAPATTESNPARVSGGAPRREKLRSRIDDDDEQLEVSRDDAQPAGRHLSPGRWPASEVQSSVRARTVSISPTPSVPHGCVVSESSLMRGKHATTARFLPA